LSFLIFQEYQLSMPATTGTRILGVELVEIIHYILRYALALLSIRQTSAEKRDTKPVGSYPFSRTGFPGCYFRARQAHYRQRFPKVQTKVGQKESGWQVIVSPPIDLPFPVLSLPAFYANVKWIYNESS
jgi:hypothetical protein